MESVTLSLKDLGATSQLALRGTSSLQGVHFGVRSDDSSQYGRKTSGSAGYGYRVSTALRASASIGTSFRAPTFNELYYPGYGNSNNKPELGKNAEVGLRYDSGTTALSATYYHNRVTDLLVNTVPCPFPGTQYQYGCAYNVSHALLEGLTMAASQQLGRFNLSGNVDLQDPRDETNDKRLQRRAKKHGNLMADYSAGALKAGVEIELSGDRYEDAANKVRLGGYGLVNLYATYHFNRDWSALVRWNNIGDKQYDLARNYATPMSKLFAGIRYGYK